MPINEKIEFKGINIAIITVSDSREEHDDTSGSKLVELITNSGHTVVDKIIIKDDINLILSSIKSYANNKKVDAVITTGGTGVTGRDVTPEALESIADKMIPGFGELFRMLSYQKIATSTLQSRACAGVVDATYVFCLPGSPGAVKDAWNDILQYQLDIRHMPCNFVELMPRLNER